MGTTIYTNDGKAFGGATPEDAVMDMCNAGLITCGKTIEEYMRGVSRRCLVMHGVAVSTKNAGEFLRDMAQLGIITIGEIQ
jgi:hypothetical protein